MNKGIRVAPSTLKTIVIVLLCIYLFYLPFFKGDVSIGLIILCAMGIFAILSKSNIILKTTEVRVYIAFVLFLIVPILYSPDVNMGFVICFKNVVSVFFLAAGFMLFYIDRKKSMYECICYLGTPLAIANILFYFFPELESQFYKGNLSNYLVAPSNLAMQAVNNSTDVLKAGTIFVNTNNASVFFSVFVFVSFYMYKETRKKKFLALILLFLSAELFTGCRGGILAIACCVAWSFLSDNRRLLKKILIVISVILLIALVLALTQNSLVTRLFGRLSFDTIKEDPRIIIWSYAIKGISFFGLGYGGWESVASGLPYWLQNMPQHNHMLILIYYGGVIAVALYLVFWLKLFFRASKSWKNLRTIYGEILGATVLNVLVHGLFDNYFLHQMNIMSFVFVIIGYSLAGISNKECEIKNAKICLSNDKALGIGE